MPHYYIPAALEATIDAQKHVSATFINTDALPLTPTPRPPACLIEESGEAPTAIMTRNLDDISICFATPAATVPIRFRYQLHRYLRFGINLVQVKISCARSSIE